MKKGFTIILFLLSVLLVSVFLTPKVSSVFSSEKIVLHKTKSFNGDHINKIEVITTSTDINFIPTPDSKIKVTLKGEINKRLKNDFKLEVKEADDQLTIAIKREDRNKFTFKNNIHTVLEVELPEKEYNAVRINGTTSDVMLRNFLTKNLSCQLTSGDIIVTDARIDRELWIETISGDTLVKEIMAGNVGIHTMSGDAIVKGMIEGDIGTRVRSGDVMMELNQLSGNINAKGTSGDISISFEEKPKSMELDFQATSGDGIANLKGMDYKEKDQHEIKGTIGSGESKVIVRTTSGDFSIGN